MHIGLKSEMMKKCFNIVVNCFRSSVFFFFFFAMSHYFSANGILFLVILTEKTYDDDNVICAEVYVQASTFPHVK